MLGERSDQRGLWEADRLYLDHVGRESFYGLLASLRGRLFRDADFAEFYCPDNGRDSVPPSLLATALLLQSHDKVSDAEAKARADFDLRWKVALGIEAEDRPFAKSTLQVFRAQLILHGKVREVFESSLRLARESGCLKGRGVRVALDTTNILGRGAVKDTYNLLADGIVKLLRALAGWSKLRSGNGPSVPRQLNLPNCRPLFLPVHLLRLAPLLGGVSPVAGDVKLQDDGVVHHPVNRRRGGHGVGEDAFPL